MNKIDNLCSKNYAVDNFREPWHAHLFALTISLNDKKIFSWSEWVAVFSKNLQKIDVRNEGNVGYFDAWLLIYFSSILAQYCISLGVLPFLETEINPLNLIRVILAEERDDRIQNLISFDFLLYPASVLVV